MATTTEPTQPIKCIFPLPAVVMACDDTNQSELRYCKACLSLLLRLQISQTPPQHRPPPSQKNAEALQVLLSWWLDHKVQTQHWQPQKELQLQAEEAQKLDLQELASEHLSAFSDAAPAKSEGSDQ